MELGFRTCHVCFDDRQYVEGDCFLDCPVFTDYPTLDLRYPSSGFIFTWRDPERWQASFTRNLLPYFKSIQDPGKRQNDPVALLFWRCYTTVFGSPDLLTPENLLRRYHQFREEVVSYFRARPDDLLILELDNAKNPWEPLCDFVGRPRPNIPFPSLNYGKLNEWDDVQHHNKLSSYK